MKITTSPDGRYLTLSANDYDREVLHNLGGAIYHFSTAKDFLCGCISDDAYFTWYDSAPVPTLVLACLAVYDDYCFPPDSAWSLPADAAWSNVICNGEQRTEILAHLRDRGEAVLTNKAPVEEESGILAKHMFIGICLLIIAIGVIGLLIQWMLAYYHVVQR